MIGATLFLAGYALVYWYFYRGLKRRDARRRRS